MPLAPLSAAQACKTVVCINDLIDMAVGIRLTAICYRTGTVYHADTERYCNAASLSWRYEY